MPGNATRWRRRSFARVSRSARPRPEARRSSYSSARPDLVILDVKLPDISGFEVCRRIKSDPATSIIPVLHISTTFVHLEDKIQGLDSGADGYLTNVAEPMELIATVRALCGPAGPRKPPSSRRGSGKPRSMRSATGSCCSMRRAESCRRTGLWNIFSVAPGARSWAESFPRLWGQQSQPADSPFARMLVSGAREAEDLSLGDLWLHVSVDPLRNAAGEIKGALCIVSDITHRKRMEMQLFRQAEELQKDRAAKGRIPGDAGARATEPAGTSGQYAPDHSNADQGKSSSSKNRSTSRAARSST